MKLSKMTLNLLSEDKRQIIHNLRQTQTMLAGLDLLQSTPDIDAVLMDIMMPTVDGYDTIRAVRKLTKFRSPIIAVTAKAMKGDREKCMEAGATDYLAKPVDTEQLFSMLRVLLYR